MNPLVCMPLHSWLSWVAALVVVVGVAVGVPVGIFCARHGAKLAIKLCSQTQGCAMREAEEKAQTTQDLEAQLRALHLKHPELAKARKAMDAVLKESDPNLPAMPEDRRATQDKDRDGHK